MAAASPALLARSCADRPSSRLARRDGLRRGGLLRRHIADGCHAALHCGRPRAHTPKPARSRTIARSPTISVPHWDGFPPGTKNSPTKSRPPARPGQHCLPVLHMLASSQPMRAESLPPAIRARSACSAPVSRPWSAVARFSSFIARASWLINAAPYDSRPGTAASDFAVWSAPAYREHPESVPWTWCRADGSTVRRGARGFTTVRCLRCHDGLSCDRSRPHRRNVRRRTHASPATGRPRPAGRPGTGGRAARNSPGRQHHAVMGVGALVVRGKTGRRPSRIQSLARASNRRGCRHE